MSDLINGIVLCSLSSALVPMLQEIPAGGDLVVGCPGDVSCSFSLEEAQLLDEESQTALPFTVIQVGGTEQGDGWAVLRPEAPLMVGQEVTIELVTGVDETFRVLPAEPFDPAEGTAFASLVFEPTTLGEVVCCGRSSSTCGGGNSCTSKRQRRRAKLNVGPGSPGHMPTQWLYQVTFRARDAEPFTSDLFPVYEVASRTFDALGPDFCYTLVAQSLADGTRVEVARACITAEDGMIGEQDTPRDERNPTLRMCTDPPAGWQTEWCDAWREGCSAQSDTEPCKDAAEICGAAFTDDAGSQHGDVDLMPRKQGDGSLCNLAAPTAHTTRAVGSTCFLLLSAALWRGFRRARRLTNLGARRTL